METLFQPPEKQFGFELDVPFWGFEEAPTFWSSPFQAIARNVKLYERMGSLWVALFMCQGSESASI